MANKVKTTLNTPARLILAVGDMPPGVLSYCAISLNAKSGKLVLNGIAWSLAMYNPDDETRIERVTVVIQRDLTLPTPTVDIAAHDARESDQVYALDFRAPFTRQYPLPLELPPDAYSAYIYPFMNASPLGVAGGRAASMSIQLFGGTDLAKPVQSVGL